MSLKLLLSTNASGLLIGKSGSTISGLQMQNQCRI
ncbi:hypothetical protein TrRE_jg9137, partial [Triparma retinervis]